MIFGHISCDYPFPLPHILQKGLDFLRNTDFSQYQPGKIPLDGDIMFAEVIDTTTRNINDSKPEIHEKYLDIHYLVFGTEYIGVVPDLGENKVFETMMPKRDITFYENVSHETFIEMFPGSYVVLFPQDVHRPCSCKNTETAIRKVVVKIAVSSIQ
ncbi:YhcH/YjgK/YiaL family protein [Commensalibacter oyaizuii]|uniref:YhcH/YjgK/YiaL family protein n=1 Tax=Commensalibacter oyaizuii TaxID=3043873 RepID=A0ABT6Q2B6_9PROT|nr:YhcH/YjgK/YiaL family protein [Commensalibacter sp. TBRC 16381]MDI2091239.1 YhcH/YjgK/YiaL family protein [Commensalibacter sp. TBRC 16381]